MKILLFSAILVSLNFISSGQKIISIRTSYYGTHYPYHDVYIATDSSYLANYKQNLMSHSISDFDVTGRRFFILVDTQTFNEVQRYLMAHNENIDPIDFPQPFTEIYYMKIFDFSKRKSIITSAFHDDKNKALSYFDELKSILGSQHASKILIDELTSVMATLKK